MRATPISRGKGDTVMTDLAFLLLGVAGFALFMLFVQQLSD
jgi:hypothetical protein